MTIYITSIKVGHPPADERITQVKWLNCSDGKTGTSDVEGIVKFIDDQSGAVAVGSPEGPVKVETVHPQGRPAYIRTVKNGNRTDNLLSLPRF